MFQGNENTIGGRIRKSRMATGQNLKEFAPRLGITANYLGMIERNDKEPSGALVRKIAEAAKVSYYWLLAGEDGSAAAPVEQVSAEEVNPQLFLGLVLARAPGMTRENLALLLAVPVETVDSILAGDSVDFSPQWANIFPALVHRMAITAVRRELKALDAFLLKEEANADREALLRALQRHVASQGLDYKIHGPIVNREISFADGAEELRTVSASRMTLQNKADAKNLWYFDFLPLPATVSQESIGEILRSYIRFADSLNPPDRLSIVLADRGIFNRFSDAASDYEGEHDKLYENPNYSSVPDAYPREMSLILVDGKTWEFLEEEKLEEKG